VGTNTSWPSWLDKNDLQLSNYLSDQGIFDDDAYNEFRYTGDPEIIAQIDLKRFDSLYMEMEHDDPIFLLKHAPLWVRFVSVNDFSTTVRIKNVMTYNGISLLGDLLDYTSVQLLKFQSMGRKSLYDLTYSIHELSKKPPRNIGQVLTPGHNKKADWYVSLLKDIPAVQTIFKDNNISGDSSYLNNRASLPENLIRQIDEYRFSSLKLKLHDKNPLELLKIVPMWLLDMNIKYFRTNQRTKNIITEQSIGSLRDFLNFTLAELSRMKNMGSNSIKKLYDDILHAKLKGPPPTLQNPLVNKLSLLQGFEKTIDNVVDAKHKYILEARLGFRREHQTLESIAERFDLTRERVRQIQKKATTYIIDEEFWDDSLKFKLLQLMQDKSEPVVLETLPEVDPWFYGFQNKIELLKNIIQAFSHLDVKFIQHEKQTILSDISQEKFDDLIRKITDSLEETIDVGYSYEDIEAIIDNELSEHNADDLSDLVFELIARQLNFVSQEGQLVLTSVGNGKGSRLKVILEEAETPLHYSLIKDLYEEKFSVEMTERNIHAALNHYKFWLYGRGVFGGQKHLPVDASILKEIASDASLHVEANSGKQWHSSELLKLIKTSKKYDQINLIDKYVMNICLQQFSSLTYLGKMIWASSNPADELQERIQIKDAVIDALTSNNAAMSTQALTNEVRKRRGLRVNLELQLQSINRIGKTAPGTWGLIYRDFGGDETYWNELTGSLHQNLHQRDSAIHKSELMDLLSSEGIYPLPKATLAFGIIQADPRFRSWGGGFIGLTDWSAPNRLTLREAAEKLLGEGMNDFTLDEFREALASKVSYPYKRTGLSVVLNNLGYQYDVQNQIWSKEKH